MTLLEKYIIEAEEDCRVDEITIQDKSLKLPAIKHKWVARLINAKREENKKKREMRQLVTELASQIKEKSKTKISDAAASSAAQRHEKVKSLQEEIDEYSSVIEYLEKVEKVFSSITWDYKNIVEIMKMETM